MFLKKLSITVLFASVVLSASFASAAEETGSEALCKGVRGKPAENACFTSRAATAADESASSYSEVLLQKGVTLAQEGRFEEAVRVFKEAAKLNPDNAKIYYNMGVAHEDLNENSKAIRAYKKAVAINPAFIDAWGNLGVTLGKNFQYAQSVEAFESALQLDPNYFDLRPGQKKAWEEAVKQKPKTYAYGHEVVIRISPSVGGIFKISGPLSGNYNNLVYIMPNGNFDFQIYRNWFATTSFLYSRASTKSAGSGHLNTYGITFGVKYVRLERDQTRNDPTFFDRSRYWFSAELGPYITSPNITVDTASDKSAKTNLGGNIGAGGEYYFHPNVAIGVAAKMHYVKFSGNTITNDYMIFQFGPTLAARF